MNSVSGPHQGQFSSWKHRPFCGQLHSPLAAGIMQSLPLLVLTHAPGITYWCCWGSLSPAYREHACLAKGHMLVPGKLVLAVDNKLIPFSKVQS